MDKTTIYAIFGKSGSGKDTVMKELKNAVDNYHILIRTTTRPKRENETDNIDYHFMTEEDFLANDNNYNFVITSKFNNWYYGLDKEEIIDGANNIGVFNISEIKTLIEEYSDIYNVVPIYISAGDKTRLLRSLCREPEPDCYEICRRFLADTEDFKEIPFNYTIIYND